MKSTKTIFLMLAGVWIILLFIEKIFNATGTIKVRSLPLPARVVHHAFRLFRCKRIYGNSAD
jgi:hypothetical protein